MSERDAKDYAIEFGEYLAKAAQNYLNLVDAQPSSTLGNADAEDWLREARGQLWSAIYEFRKRAAKASINPRATP